LRLADSQFFTTDPNARSVLIYGVKYIKNNPIQEVRIIGHTDCGGVKICREAVDDSSIIPPELRVWLQPLLKLARKHQGQSLLTLTEENVRAQMRSVHKVLKELELKRTVKVRGFVYHIAERELREVTEEESLLPIFQKTE
jgi:carbonic anhydrase